MSYQEIVTACRFLLKNYPTAQEAQEYLNSRISPNVQDVFQFGYFPNLKNLHALQDLVGEQVLRNYKLLFSRYVEDALCPRILTSVHFEHHPLIMPFHDAHGNILSLVGRTLLPEMEMKSLNISKYWNTIGFKKGNCLFGLYENKQSIIDNNCVYVVEGQFDLIKAYEVGLTNIVALGTSHMTNYQFALLSRYTNNIILLLDNDDAGEKGRQQIISKYDKFANFQNWYIPEPYKDLDEYLRKENIFISDQINLSIKM